MSKVEVTESRTIDLTEENVRKLSNPHRDRSLTLTVFELNKIFCVNHAIDRVVPVLAFRAPRLVFDRAFLMKNGDFLIRQLVDQRLGTELASALETASAVDDVMGIEEKKKRLAKQALMHLFSDHDVHLVGDPARYDHVDEPAFSFDTVRPGAYNYHPSGYDATAGKDYARELMFLLGSFRVLAHRAGYLLGAWNDETRFDVVQLVLALAAEVTPLWSMVSLPHKTALFDRSQPTAVIRRIPAFLSIVERILKPLAGRTPEGSDATRQRAEAVLQRALVHLDCFREYYTPLFHAFLWQISQRTAHIDMVRDAVTNSLGLSAEEKAFVFRNFDVEKLTLSGSTLYLPYRGDDANATLKEWLPKHSFSSLDVVRDTVVVPADGVIIEPSLGTCVLPDIPRSPAP